MLEGQQEKLGEVTSLSEAIRYYDYLIHPDSNNPIPFSADFSPEKERLILRNAINYMIFVVYEGKSNHSGVPKDVMNRLLDRIDYEAPMISFPPTKDVIDLHQIAANVEQKPQNTELNSSVNSNIQEIRLTISNTISLGIYELEELSGVTLTEFYYALLKAMDHLTLYDDELNKQKMIAAMNEIKDSSHINLLKFAETYLNTAEVSHILSQIRRFLI